MNKLLMFLCAATLVFAMTGTVSAVIITGTADNFNRPNNNNTGWYQEKERNANDIKIKNGRMQIRDYRGGVNNKKPSWVKSNSFSTTGYTNVALKFRLGVANNTEPHDLFRVRYTLDDITWTTLYEETLGGSAMSLRNINAGVWDNQSFVRMMYWTKMNRHNELVRIDNHRVTGDMAPVPEPATIALLGIGIVGLAGAELRRRRKKKAVDEA